MENPILEQVIQPTALSSGYWDTIQNGLFVKYDITISWDNESDMWIAVGDGEHPLNGLVLEAGSFDLLLERIRLAAGDLLEAQGVSSEEINRSKIQIHINHFIGVI